MNRDNVKKAIREWLTMADLHLQAVEKVLPEKPAQAEAEIRGAREEIRHAKAAVEAIAD